MKKLLPTSLLILGLAELALLKDACPAQAGPVSSSRSGVDEKGRSPADLEKEAQENRRISDAYGKRNEEARKAFVRLARIEGDSNHCLAYDGANGECLATVQSFNSALEPHASQQFGPLTLDSIGRLASAARKEVRDAFEEEAFLSDRLEKSGKNSEIADSARKEQQAAYANTARAIPESRLRELGDQYRDLLARKFEKTPLEVYASTDSAFIDSLNRFLIGGKRPPCGAAWERWHPSIMALKDVPEGVSALMDTVQGGRWIGPIRCGYGFFLLRWRIKGVRNRVPFGEKLPLLVLLASRRPAAIPNLSERTKVYLAANGKTFMQSETTFFSVSLHPNAKAPKSGVGQVPVEKGCPSEGGGRDFKSLLVRESELPQDVDRELDPSHAWSLGKTFGPMESKLGIWTLERKYGPADGEPSLQSMESEIRKRIADADLSQAFEEAVSLLESKRASRALGLGLGNYLRDAEAGLPENEMPAEGADTADGSESPDARQRRRELSRAHQRGLQARARMEKNKSDWIESNIRWVEKF